MATGRIPINGTAAIQQTLIDAKGDLIAGTGADAVARLAVGANGTTLVADSAEATGLKWATPASGGMTLISTTTLTGSSVSLTSIPGTYKDLQLVFRSLRPNTDNAAFSIRINGDTSANRYVTISVQDNGNQAFADDLWTSSNGIDNTATTGTGVMTIFDYANTSTFKIATGFYGFVNATTTTNMSYSFFRHAYNQTGAITQINLFPSSGTWNGGTVLLYGVS